MIVEFRKYQSVAPFSQAQHDHVIPAGQVLFLNEIGGSSIPSDINAKVTIVFDPVGTTEMLLATGAEARQSTTKRFDGDGIKVIRILLDNQTATAKIMGGYFIGDS